MAKHISPNALADELESGAWRKGVGRLGRSNGARCVLGVLTELSLDRKLTPEERNMTLPPNEVHIANPWLDDHREPADHWVEGSDPQDMPDVVSAIGLLTHLNDRLPGWGKVIDFLRHKANETPPDGVTPTNPMIEPLL